jgi:hypothetical protein
MTVTITNGDKWQVALMIRNCADPAFVIVDADLDAAVRAAADWANRNP